VLPLAGKTPDEGILVQKGSAGDISVRVVGAVKIGSSGGATYSGTTISANPYPVDITLAETGIESALGATDGTDIVLLWDADAQAPSGLFFHNGTNWQDFGGANQDGAVVPAGAAILISRGTTEALNWSAAQPF